MRGFRRVVSDALRPAVFALPFWTALGVTYTKKALDFFGEGGRFGLPALSAVALASA